MGKEKAAEEEIKRKAAEAARVRAAEEARLKAEADAKKAAEEETRRKAAEEARYRAAEEARLKAEEAARKLAEEEAKLKARLEAVVKSQQTPMVVASAPSAPDPTRAPAPQMDEGDIARLLQFHLKRVGCDPGTVDGKWTDQSAHAMAEFNKRAKANFEVKVASLGALDAVKQQKARLCPLVCGKGFKVEEDRCVAEACRRGFVRNKATGDCERETKSATRPPSREDGNSGGGGGQIYCSERGGCSSVPKNCRIVTTANGGGTGSGTPSAGGQTVVCN
jgi:membrane protein involved in colicin uptake